MFPLRCGTNNSRPTILLHAGWIGDVFDTSIILEDSMVDTVPDPSNLSGEKIKVSSPVQRV